MYFTREDILKIQRALLQIGTKDSEFKNAELPLLDLDIITIVLNGANRKVSVNNIIGLFNLLDRLDFINVSDTYDEHYITINEAIKLLPNRKRKEGLVITFLNIKGKWLIYLFKGTVDKFVDPSLWEDLFSLEYPIINSIIPDEEDLTMSKPDEDGNSLLSFKDKDYDFEGFSGMATKILRKNIKEINKTKRNVLTLEDFDKEYCIYEIKYDFDLNGGEIIIPKKSILRFNGGTIKNGLVREWNLPVFPEYFGAVGDGVTDDTDAFVNLFESLYYEINDNRNYKFRHDIIELTPNREYIIKKSLFINPTNTIEGNNSRIIPSKDNEFIEYNGYKRILISGINKALDYVSYRYASYTTINNLLINNIANILSNTSFCLYGNSLKINNCKVTGLLNFILNIPLPSSILYCDNMYITNVVLTYWRDGDPNFDKNWIMIKKQCNGDGLYMQNVINETHCKCVSISSSTEGIVINSCLHFDGVLSGVKGLINGAHNERQGLKIYSSHITINDSTFYNTLDDCCVLALNSKSSTDDCKLILNNCTFFRHNQYELLYPLVITNSKNVVVCNNTYSVSRILSLVKDNVYTVNKDFINISIFGNIYIVPNNETIQITDVNFDCSQYSKNDFGKLTSGDYVYTFYYYIPKYKIAYKKSITASVDDNNNSLYILADKRIHLPVYIVRTHNGVSKYIILNYSYNGVYLDTGDVINGMLWKDNELLSLLDILLPNDTISVNNDIYYGNIQNKNYIESNRLDINLKDTTTCLMKCNSNKVYQLIKIPSLFYISVVKIYSDGLEITVNINNGRVIVDLPIYMVLLAKDSNYIYIKTSNYFLFKVIHYLSYTIPESTSAVDVDIDGLTKLAYRNFMYLPDDPAVTTPGFVYYNYQYRLLLITNNNGEFKTLDGYDKGYYHLGSSENIPNFSGNVGFQYFDYNRGKPIWKSINNWVYSDGTDISKNKYGTTENRPTDINTYFKYYDTTVKLELIWNGTMWVNALGNNPDVLTKGTTLQRPTLETGDEGFLYYDTTLREPIWWNGTLWIDGTNTPVE